MSMCRVTIQDNKRTFNPEEVLPVVELRRRDLEGAVCDEAGKRAGDGGGGVEQPHARGKLIALVEGRQVVYLHSCK